MRSSINLNVRRWVVVVASLILNLLVVANRSSAEDTSTSTPAAASSATDAPRGNPGPAPPKMPEPKGARRLSKDYPVWIDPKEKAVIVEGQVSLREGFLEMFACTRNTKEHESIISANTKAYLVHTGLVALGAEPGHPVRFQPRFEPPTGTEIEVLVRYLDEKGKVQTARAQDWIKDHHTGKPMAYPFVFGGSSFYTDPDTKKQYYQAEQGDFVCVANFGTAMLDIPVKSSKSNEELEFQALTEKIPPLGAPVHLVLKPKLSEREAGSHPESTRQGAGIKNKLENKTNGSPKKSVHKAK